MSVGPEPSPRPLPPVETSAPRATDLRLLGWVATASAIAMYVSYVSQIRLNLSGHPGSAVLPLATVVNCTLWVAYGWARPVRDWPIVLANLPGVVLGAVAFLTSF